VKLLRFSLILCGFIVLFGALIYPILVKGGFFQSPETVKPEDLWLTAPMPRSASYFLMGIKAFNYVPLVLLCFWAANHIGEFRPFIRQSLRVLLIVTCVAGLIFSFVDFMKYISLSYGSPSLPQDGLLTSYLAVAIELFAKSLLCVFAALHMQRLK